MMTFFIQKMILQNRHIRYSTVCLTNGAHLPAPSKPALGINKAFLATQGHTSVAGRYPIYKAAFAAYAHMTFLLLLPTHMLEGSFFLCFLECIS